MFQYRSTSRKFITWGGDRLSLLYSSSYQISVCGRNATAVAVALNGYHFGVTVAHFPCNKQCPTGLIHCKSLDASLDIRGCPLTKYSLDATQFTDANIGDDVFVYGFPTNTHVRNYRAMIGYEHGYFHNGSAFNNEAIIRPNYRHLIGGDQQDGLSGSCVLNGYGIVGLACAYMNDSPSVSVVVPWPDIYQCIAENMRDGNITFPSDCKATVVAPPTLYNRIEKNFIPWIKRNDYLKLATIWIYNNM